MDRAFKEQKVPILMYHSISDHATHKFAPFAVAPELFAAQMDYLHQQSYASLTVTQFAEMVQKEVALPERPIIITFDDGFADFFSHALPILQRYSFVATLYITTGFVNSTSRWLRREEETNRPMLTWDQVVEVNRHGIECGAHTHTHPQLDILPSSQAQEEIVKSKALLEDHLEQKVLSFAYPFGYYTTGVRKLVQMAGYTSACAVKHAMSSTRSDPFALTRHFVPSDMNIDTFASVLDNQQSARATLYTGYTRLRTPVWQIIRKSSFFLTQHT